MFKKAIQRVKAWYRYTPYDRYLAEAKDVIDLEHRMRNWENYANDRRFV